MAGSPHNSDRTAIQNDHGGLPGSYTQHDAGRTEEGGKQRPLTRKERFLMRVHHFSFAWFASTMSTGGVSVAINAMPLYFGTAQYVIGVTVFICDLILFTTLTSLMITRFVAFPSTFRNAVMHPRESQFIPCWFLSIASIILAINSFAPSHTGPWIVVLLRVLFWMYVCVAFPSSIFFYMTQFMHAKETLETMAPTWCLGIFQIMLSGTIASQIASSQDSKNGVPIIIAGFMMQGLGFWVSLAIIGVFFQKIFSAPLMPPSARFGLYMFVGAPGFTSLALIGLGRSASSSGVFYMDFILGVPGAANIARVWCDLFGAFFWGFTAWLCLFATAGVVMGFLAGDKLGSQMTFNLSWFAFIFPNVGFTIGTMLLAEEFGSEALKIVTAVMVVVLFVALLALWFGAIRAIIKGQIMMPGKDEDKAIDGFEGEFKDFGERYPREATMYKVA